MNAYTLWDEYDTRLVGGRVVSAYDPRRGTYVRRFVQQLGAGVPTKANPDAAMKPDRAFFQANSPAAKHMMEMKAQNEQAIVDYVASCAEPPTSFEIAEVTGVSLSTVRNVAQRGMIRKVAEYDRTPYYGVPGQVFPLRCAMSDKQWRVFEVLRTQPHTQMELAAALNVDKAYAFKWLRQGLDKWWYVSGHLPNRVRTRVYALYPIYRNVDTFTVA